MKHIKLFENFDTKSIEEICKNFNIGNYTINDDGTIDIDGNISINVLHNLPLKFGKVTGYFSCSSNVLTSLEGSPGYVGGNFDIGFNKLTSLKGCPKYVGGDFECVKNMLTSLEGCPEYVGGDFDIRLNNIKDLRNCPTYIGGKFRTGSDSLSIIYDILKSNLECVNNFYDFHILDNLEDEKPTLNLKRLNRFIELYELDQLTDELLNDIKNYFITI